jgi:ATP-binding cassette, subfamily B, bacterial
LNQSRRQGAGELLGVVMESAAVEQLAGNNALLVLVTTAELLFAIGLLVLGAGGWVHAFLALLWLAGTGASMLRLARRKIDLTAARLRITRDLVERMVGHRTRVAQQDPADWHRGEDAALHDYLVAAERIDRSHAWIAGMVPKGWVLLGVASMAPAFLSGAEAALYAPSLAGVLLGSQALGALCSHVSQLIDAAIAWKWVGPLYAAAVEPERHGPSDVELADVERAPGQPIVELCDASFSHAPGQKPVLDNVNLTIRSGDRILLEGPSGAGKSTLAAVMAGLRTIQSGLLLVRGLDTHTLGASGVRRHVALAPQFHENHLLSESVAFNLLMGRRWPPRPQDLDEARAVCRELGLQDLLARMPAGLEQRVGETGWQLSHGERSRVFLARALLQRPDLVILDESFAALDPESLQRAVACIEKRAVSVLAIAHP